MTSKLVAIVATLIGLVGVVAPAVRARQSRLTPEQAAALAAENTPDPAIQRLVSRLDLDRYTATIKSLTAFGDRREGTQRNRDAVDWIEAQLKGDGYTNTARVVYALTPPTRPCGPSVPADLVRGGPPATAPAAPGFPRGPGGSRLFGVRQPVGVNCDPARQPDPAVRALDSQPVINAPVSEVYCTKIGTTRPDEMFIVGAHMDGIGYGQAANDDGSGTALVLELARIFAAADVSTERSIRFVLWNGEEGGLNGSRAYVAQRKALQGREDPPGSRQYPEPTWLGLIQHDMLLWDHGMPRADGTLPRDQRPEADINIEFQSIAATAHDSQALAWTVYAASQKYATDYPATVGPHMTNTDTEPFEDLTPAISIRENERGREIQAGWDPNWHQPSDMFATYSEKDFRLGLNAAQATLAALAQLAGLRR